MCQACAESLYIDGNWVGQVKLLPRMVPRKSSRSMRQPTGIVEMRRLDVLNQEAAVAIQRQQASPG